MVKTLVDMYVKQSGSYQRLIGIVKGDYPNAKLIRTRTITCEGFPVLMLTFDTKE